MAYVSSLIEHLGEANPRMYLAEAAPGDAVPQLNAGIHSSSQVLPAPGETEIGRYGFTGGIGTAVSPASGQPFRMLSGPEADEAQVIPLISGIGMAVVTDRRLLGQLNGDSQLSDRIGARDQGALFFSMGYEDMDAITLSQTKSMFGGLKELRVGVQGLYLGGFVGMEVINTMSLRGDDVSMTKLKTARPLFEQLVQAAATYRLALGPDAEDRVVLERTLAGHTTTEDGDLVADLIADREL